MKLIIASNNEHKIHEIKTILQGRFDVILSLNEANIHCNPDENGETFAENALIKATAIGKMTDCAVLADDTGLRVDALNGEPGVMSARYAENHDNAKNRAKLLEKLKGTTDRSAHFSTAIALLLPDGKIITAEGRVDGYVLEREDGTNGFGYDSLFYCYELGKSFGRATEQEKNSVSHRARALKNLLEKIEKEYD